MNTKDLYRDKLRLCIRIPKNDGGGIDSMSFDYMKPVNHVTVASIHDTRASFLIY